MLLQRRLVKILDEYNLNNQVGIIRQAFVLYVIENKLWPRINYFWYKKDKFCRKIDAILGDCIRGTYGYISEDDDGKTILVTIKGRDFIKIPLGFFEEFLKRRKRTSHFLFGGALGVIISVLTWFVVHFWPWISSKLGL